MNQRRLVSVVVPVFNETEVLDVFYERLKKVILDYADGYNNNSLTDAQAKKLSDEALAIEADEAKMRKDYSVKLNGVVPAKKAARYLQIENKIRAVIRYDLADGIPLVP